MPAGTPPTDALALRDIHLPDPVLWWPLAPGWWILLGLAVAGIIAFLLIKKIQQARRLKKAALAEFEIICDAYQREENPAQLVRSLSTLLRRICLSYYPNTKAPGMTGKQWLAYLDQTTDNKGFQSEQGHILATAPYLPEHECPDYDTTALLLLCKAWIRAQPVKDART